MGGNSQEREEERNQAGSMKVDRFPGLEMEQEQSSLSLIYLNYFYCYLARTQRNNTGIPFPSLASLYRHHSHKGPPLRPYNSLLIPSCSKIGFSRLSGFVVLAHRPLTFPSFPTSHFSKFHFTRFIPNKPGCSFFNHSKRGFAADPFTSVLPNCV